ncbi:MAG: primosomal protein N' [Anaerolineaceae bacterium]|nr:primosomal protein N' [Anaerolineaceae bacterium]
MSVYVEVSVNVPRVIGTFSYHLPENLIDRVTPGSMVTVPFGNQRVQGIVTRIATQPNVAQTRPVEELVDESPVINSAQMKLADWLSRETLAPLSCCLDAMIPPGLSQHVDILVRPVPGQPVPIAGTLNPLESRLVKLLGERGSLRGRQIQAALPRQNWKVAVRSLEKRGLVTSSSHLPPPAVRPKYIRTAQLAIPAEKISEYSTTLGHQTQVVERRMAVLQFLAAEPWPVDIAWVYAASRANLSDLQYLEELGLILLSESEVWRDPLKDYEVPLEKTPILTEEQKAVWDEIQNDLSALSDGISIQPILLNGVTGSGKTEIYLRAIQAVIQLGGQAIYLIPEISLTPQTIRRVLGRFPGRVGVIHSRLSIGERYDTWRRARAGLLSVVIGPRSALFTPFPNLRLIVVDECHEEAYYQSEAMPYYHAANSAAAYGFLAKAMVILGSATPNVTQIYQAEQGKWRELKLPNRIFTTSSDDSQMTSPTSDTGLPVDSNRSPRLLPGIHMVDMREELKAGNRSIFSRLLLSTLRATLAANHQAILFLNRRGSATYIFCRNCGLTLKCPNCDKPLTLHNPLGELLCHSCGYTRKQVHKCPQCASDQIQALGVGTERVESELQSLFPQIKTLRWDHDTTRQKGAHEVILAHFSQHRADVLIGTQMLAKGLDLPLVTLVGVILADISINLPDYRSAERTFQILTQVSGRAGRSTLGGNVVLQTYQPDHYAIQAVTQHDLAGFYRMEKEYRRQLRYPPFSHLLRMEYRHHQSEQAELAAHQMAAQAQVWLERSERRSTDLIGPAPCYFAREKGLFRWQLILRGPDPAQFISDSPLPEGWKVEMDPPNLL